MSANSKPRARQLDFDLFLFEQMSVARRKQLLAELASRVDLLKPTGWMLLPIEEARGLLQSGRQLKSKVVSYERGPRTLNARSQALVNAIRYALQNGTPRNAKDVLAALKLRDDAEQLVHRKGKLMSLGTVKNYLTKIK